MPAIQNGAQLLLSIHLTRAFEILKVSPFDNNEYFIKVNKYLFVREFVEYLNTCIF